MGKFNFTRSCRFFQTIKIYLVRSGQNSHRHLIIDLDHHRFCQLFSGNVGRSRNLLSRVNAFGELYSILNRSFG